MGAKQKFPGNVASDRRITAEDDSGGFQEVDPAVDDRAVQFECGDPVPQQSARERALLEIDRITYDAPLDTATLTVLPEGINWTDQTRNTPSPRLTGIDAKEAARLILAAFATWDNEILDEALRSYGAHARKLLQSRLTPALVRFRLMNVIQKKLKMARVFLRY